MATDHWAVMGIAWLILLLAMGVSFMLVRAIDYRSRANRR